ncbi:hypothetical protein OF83DRAFT_371327 [Amylostereum chailletii]|nr:hypothetical protein OF83DRAFT_371327 [Amylostereum chailletii]
MFSPSRPNHPSTMTKIHRDIMAQSDNPVPSIEHIFRETLAVHKRIHKDLSAGSDLTHAAHQLGEVQSAFFGDLDRLERSNRAKCQLLQSDAQRAKEIVDFAKGRFDLYHYAELDHIERLERGASAKEAEEVYRETKSNIASNFKERSLQRIWQSM